MSFFKNEIRKKTKKYVVYLKASEIISSLGCTIDDKIEKNSQTKINSNESWTAIFDLTWFTLNENRENIPTKPKNTAPFSIGYANA